MQRMSAQDAISLTRSLLQFDTVNPPGREQDCARHAGKLLEDWGYAVQYQEFEPGRTSVIARAGGSEAKAPLCLTGHLDVVPLGTRKWARDPFAGETDGDRLYGRGSSDMKAGVAAMLLAAKAFAGKLAGTPGVVLVLTASEENGCIGSRHLAELPELMGKAGAIVVGEPSANQPYVGHKGSLKFHAAFRGVSAHGSMPELGENAIYKAARAVAALEKFDFHAHPHPVMGAPTMNVGTIEGGAGVNLVPDSARIGVDIRTVPGMDHAALLGRAGKDAGRGRAGRVLQPAGGLDRAGPSVDAARVRDLRRAARRRACGAGRDLHDRRGEPAQAVGRRADRRARAGRAAAGAPDRRVLQHGAESASRSRCTRR